MRDRKSDGGVPLEIYVHIPFCVRKCLYCDFLSGSSDRGMREAYAQAVLNEIDALPSAEGREATSVFVGGGTPSVLEQEWMGRILEKLREKFLFSPDTEITMEANPGTLTREKLETYRACGVNRLSLGLQSADDGLLRTLGRIHTYREFLESYALARETGFSNINVDLMFGLPGQTCGQWTDCLERVAALAPEHISAYSLIVEEGTPFSEMELALPDEEEEYRMYEDTAGILAGYGFRQYEISNYARDGFACRHNVGYWKRREYLGIGLGAASFYEGQRYSNTRSMEEYIRRSSCPEALRRDTVRLTEQDAMEEFMFLGLRMTEGIRGKDFQEQFGRSLESVYGGILHRYETLGFLEHEGDFWRFTRSGIHVSNRILADFLF